MGNSIVHIEVAVNDPRGAGAFYKEVFGWKIEIDERFDYVQFTPDEGPGGAFPGVGDTLPNPGDVLVYIGVDDIEATLAKIESRGGKTIVPKTEIPGIGWFAIFSDPAGGRLALYTSMVGQA